MNTPLHFTKFNEKIKALNSGYGRELKMTAAEARALHTDIFELLEELNEYRAGLTSEPAEIEIVLDAGNNSL
jgi:hypothetical protein